MRREEKEVVMIYIRVTSSMKMSFKSSIKAVNDTMCMKNKQ